MKKRESSFQENFDAQRQKMDAEVCGDISLGFVLSILYGLRNFHDRELIAVKGLFRSMGHEYLPEHDPYRVALAEAIRCVEMVHGIRDQKE